MLQPGDRCIVRGEPGVVLDVHADGADSPDGVFVHTRHGTYWTSDAEPMLGGVQKANTQGKTWHMENASKQQFAPSEFYQPARDLIADRDSEWNKPEKYMEGLDTAQIENMKQNPHMVLWGSMAQQQRDADEGWRIPHLLHERGIDMAPAALAQMDHTELATALRGPRYRDQPYYTHEQQTQAEEAARVAHLTGTPEEHRAAVAKREEIKTHRAKVNPPVATGLENTVAAQYIEGARHLMRHYGGDFMNVFKGHSSPEELNQRLSDFPGIGDFKKGPMIMDIARRFGWITGENFEGHTLPVIDSLAARQFGRLASADEGVQAFIAGDNDKRAPFVTNLSRQVGPDAALNHPSFWENARNVCVKNPEHLPCQKPHTPEEASAACRLFAMCPTGHANQGLPMPEGFTDAGIPRQVGSKLFDENGQVYVFPQPADAKQRAQAVDARAKQMKLPEEERVGPKRQKKAKKSLSFFKALASKAPANFVVSHNFFNSSIDPNAMHARLHNGSTRYCPEDNTCIHGRSKGAGQGYYLFNQSQEPNPRKEADEFGYAAHDLTEQHGFSPDTPVTFFHPMLRRELSGTLGWLAKPRPRGLYMDKSLGQPHDTDEPVALRLPTPDLSPHLHAMLSDIKSQGGKPYLVGGYVRDALMGKENKDFDIEVHGMEPAHLNDVASRHGQVNEAGASFTVLKMKLPNGEDIDLSVPRTEHSTGTGHKDFNYAANPHLGLREAARRRDFTMNSMFMDPLTGDVHDPYNGVEDTMNRKLKIVDPTTFLEDPLRILRGAQFASRFDLSPDPDTMDTFRKGAPTISGLSKERFAGEWKKLLAGDHPHRGLELLNDAGVIDQHYPELAALKGTPQDPRWHPEGDVWQHTLQTVNAMSKFKHQLPEGTADHHTLMMAALLHDVGKPATTKHEDDGRITSYGHDEQGVSAAESFMDKIGLDSGTREKVSNLVRNHMWAHTSFGGKVNDNSIRRMAGRLHPATIADLAALSSADENGAGEPSANMETEEYKWLMDRAQKLGVQASKPAPVMEGRDVLSTGVLKPGPEVGIALRQAELLLDQTNHPPEQVKQMVLDTLQREGLEGLYRLTNSEPEVPRPRRTFKKSAPDHASSLMVGFSLPYIDPEEDLTIPGGESPEELHITLGFFGKDLSPESIEHVRTAVRQLAQKHGPITIKIPAKLGRFPGSEHSDWHDVIHAKVESPELHTLHKELQELTSDGPAKMATNFAYTPHITLAYVDHKDPTPPDIKPRTMQLKNIGLFVGRKMKEYPLTAGTKKSLSFVRYG